MYHAISKVLGTATQPSTLVLLVLLAGAALLFTRAWRWGRTLVAIAAALYLIGGILPLSTWLTLPLEQRFSRPDLSGAEVTGIIVLGGAEDARVSAGRHTHAINESGERITEAAALALRYPRAKIVFTSNSARFGKTRTTGAEAANQIFRDLGIAQDRLVPENASHNTWENALYSKRLVNPEPGQRWLLVTSASHMPRAIAVFRKVGFPVEPWPVDYRTAGPGDAWKPFEAPTEGLKRLEMAVHEWVGLIAYRLMGRSDALFPAP
jgi:uncharacterized SAM-binding protein YcdF (DUF218 family)